FHPCAPLQPNLVRIAAFRCRETQHIQVSIVGIGYGWSLIQHLVQANRRRGRRLIVAIDCECDEVETDRYSENAEYCPSEDLERFASIHNVRASCRELRIPTYIASLRNSVKRVRNASRALQLDRRLRASSR